ncbi:META domain-containing protein [bacterium]|nr:META domain-containing protein [bacterium]
MTNRHADTIATLGLASMLLLQACAARATASPTPVPAAPAAPATVAGASALAPIAGSEWTLVELDGKPVPTGDRRPSLSVEGSRVSGFSGCNRWGAEVVAAQAGTWKLGPIASTRMACEEDEMKLESGFLDALGAATRWKVDGARLLLAGEDGKTRLAFTGQRPR